jgi:hypothetical protein
MTFVVASLLLVWEAKLDAELWVDVSYKLSGLLELVRVIIENLHIGSAQLDEFLI